MLLLFLLLDHHFGVFVAELLEDISVKEGVADGVELALELVEVAVEALVENLIHGAELQLGLEAAGEFFGVVAKAAAGHAGDVAQGGVELADAEAGGAGEILVEEKKFRHQARMHLGAVEGFVGVPRAAGAQNGLPAEGFGLADAFGRAAFGQTLVAHVQDAGGLVRPLDKLARL